MVSLVRPHPEKQKQFGQFYTAHEKRRQKVELPGKV